MGRRGSRERIREWADAEDKPNGKCRDAHVWYDAGGKQNFTAYKLLITDIVNGRMPSSAQHAHGT
jgi:hypothetical protein